MNSHHPGQEDVMLPVAATAPQADRDAARSAPMPAVPAEVLERMTDAFFALDASWRFTYLNAAAERLLERPRAELLGQVVWGEFPEAVGTIFQRQYEESRASGEMRSFQGFYPPLDRWFAVRAYPSAEHDALTVYFQDVTAEHARERRAHLLFETLPQGMMVFDHVGTITSANPAAQAILGLNADELLGRTQTDLPLQLVREDGTPWLAENRPSIVAARTGEPVMPQVIGILRGCDGQESTLRWIRVTAMPLHDPQSGSAREVAEIFVIFDDITQRKQAEEQLLASEARFRSTFENAAVGIAHVSLCGQWLLVNDRLCAIVGYTREELLQRTFQDITHPDDLAADLEHMREMLAGERDRYEMEKRYLRKDGSIVWVRLTVALARDAARAPQYFISVAEDITERKRIHEMLAESESKFRLLADNMSQFAWMADGAGEIFWYNQRWYDYTGTTLDDVRGWGWRRVHHPEHVDRVVTRIQHAWDTGELWEDTFPLRGKDGQYRWFLSRAVPIRDASGKVVRWFGTNTDIEDQRQLQDQLFARNVEALQAKEEVEEHARQLSAILNTMEDSVALVGVSGVILRTNPAFKRLLERVGLPESTAIGDYDTVFSESSLGQPGMSVHLMDAAGHPLAPDQWPVARLLRGETFAGSQAIDLRLRGMRGREVVVNTSGVPLRDEQSVPVGGVLVLRDVTERYQRDAERVHMLNVVAHELRSPVTSLKVSIQINQRRAARGVTLTPEHLEPEARSVERMERMINDLLDAARLDTEHLELHPAQTDLVVLCEQVVSEQMAVSGRGIALDLPTTSMLADVDSGRIAQVVGNLLSNALKYSPSEASVSLRLRESDGDAVLTVQDGGPGIPKDALPHLFERFYRAPGVEVLHGSGVGLGVGLYLCKQFVERHGGDITVTSRLGHGTTFTVRLPLARTPGEEAETTDHSNR